MKIFSGYLAVTGAALLLAHASWAVSDEEERRTPASSSLQRQFLIEEMPAFSPLPRAVLPQAPIPKKKRIYLVPVQTALKRETQVALSTESSTFAKSIPAKSAPVKVVSSSFPVTARVVSPLPEMKEVVPSQLPQEIFVISATRAPVRPSQVSQNITVVSEEEMKRLPVHDPSEVFFYVPGIDVDPRTGFGHFRPLSIQGSESRHVRVMVDGIPFNTQLSGQADILPVLPLENLRQMEIVKGTASTAWGSALGGAVNLVTKSAVDFKDSPAHAKTSFAEFGTQWHELSFGNETGPIGYTGTMSYLNSGGQREAGPTTVHEDSLHKKWFGKIESVLSDVVKAVASFGYSGAEVHEGVYPQLSTWNEMPYYARYGQARLVADPSDAQHFEAAWKLNRQRIQSRTFLDPEDLLLSDIASSDNYQGAELKSITQIGERASVVAGYDFSYDVLKTTLMAQSRDIHVHAPYANTTLDLHPVTLVGGVRYDDNEEFGSQWSPSAGAVLEIPFLPRSRIRGNVARGFSAPPLLWKYFEDIAPGLTVNNPDIRAERGLVYEAGFETRFWEPLELKFNFYHSLIRDAIATVVTDDGFFMKDNFDRFRQEGVEFQARWRMGSGTELFFASAFNGVENLETHEQVRGRGVTRPSFRLGLNYENSFLKGGFWGRYNRWDSVPEAEADDRKFIFDASLGHTFRQFFGLRGATLSLNAYNLTNSKYWSDINLPSPPRYFEGAVSVDF